MMAWTSLFLLFVFLQASAEKLRLDEKNLSSDVSPKTGKISQSEEGAQDEEPEKENFAQRQRKRKDGSSKMESLEPELITETTPPVRDFSKRGEIVKKNEGLLAEYGLVFLISAGSLAVIAGSLLGLSIACNKNNRRTDIKGNVHSASKSWARTCTTGRVHKTPKSNDTLMQSIATEKYSLRALADSFVGSIRSVTSSLSGSTVERSELEADPFGKNTATTSEDGAWTVYHTEEGIPYFYNALTGKASWEPPRQGTLPSSYISDSESAYSMPPNTCASKSSLP